MVRKPQEKNTKDVGGQLFEELFFEFIEKKYDISRKDLSRILEEKAAAKNSFPVAILRSEKLSGLEAIVKFLRENRKLSYIDIGRFLGRNAKTLAVTYSIASRKMHIPFDDSMDLDKDRIPFDAFSKDLSILESICFYLKSKGNSYSDISRMIGKDPRTVWTVCKRAERKIVNKDKHDG